LAAKVNVAVLTVGEWYTRHSEALQLRLLGPAVGFDRVIREPTINRPGLALSGFFAYFAVKRIQVLGSAELSYLKSLSKDEVRARSRELFSRSIPCLVIARAAKPPPALR
jgi:HPr kinase/phosphorylase